MSEMDSLMKLKENHDQMLMAMNFGKYVGFEEPEILFLPTYKRSKTDKSFVNKKNQAPSYCDRILVKNNTSNQLNVTNYTSLEDFYGSDHRPVVLEFETELPPIRYMNMDHLLNPQKMLS